MASLPTPANTNSKVLRELAAELEALAMSYLLGAAILKASADTEWPQ